MKLQLRYSDRQPEPYYVETTLFGEKTTWGIRHRRKWSERDGGSWVPAERIYAAHAFETRTAAEHFIRNLLRSDPAHRGHVSIVRY